AEYALVEEFPGPGLVPVSLSTTRGYCVMNVSCFSSDIPAGARYTITFVAHIDPDAVGPITNRATLDSRNDTNPLNNSTEDTGSTTPSADVSLAKTASADEVVVGDVVTFTLTATNHGSSSANDIVIADAVPGGFTLLTLGA